MTLIDAKTIKDVALLTEFLMQSNAIEGVYDTKSFDQALEAWSYLITEPKLTPGVILKTHKILMLHQKLQPDEKGYFRKVEVSIGWRYGLRYPLVPKAIDSWCKEANLTVSLKDELNAEGQLQNTIRADHIAYEKIHPFVDGNGRTGRMFLNWQRVQCGLDILVIMEKNKQAYYQWFD